MLCLNTNYMFTTNSVNKIPMLLYQSMSVSIIDCVTCDLQEQYKQSHETHGVQQSRYLDYSKGVSQHYMIYKHFKEPINQIYYEFLNKFHQQCLLR